MRVVIGACRIGIGLILFAQASQAATDPLHAARALRRKGRYAVAEVAARKKLVSTRTRCDALTLLGELARETGRHEQAIAQFQEALKTKPHHLRARVYLALTLQELGRDDEAKLLIDGFYDDWDAGLLNHKSAEDLTYAAMAVRAGGGYQDANDTFRDAVRANRKFVQANLEWGNLFLEKYAAGHAETCFKDALAIDGDNPDAHVGLARVKLLQNYDAAGAGIEIDRALAVNPHHPDAHAIRAAIALDAEDHVFAAAEARAAMATNPRHLGAQVVLAASAWLRNDRAAYDTLRQSVLAVNPRASAFDHGVAEAIAKFNRYEDARTMEEAALRLRPDDPLALAGLAQNWLRLGDEPRGLEALHKAWDGDPFNVRVYNLLNLFDEVIPRDYTFVESAHFRLRLPKTRTEAIAKPILDHLERAFSVYVKKYRFTPKTPIGVELFEKPEQYAVRTVGLPGLSALGVCFGQVITSMAPTGAFNWAQVLSHELSHVFTIAMSRARIPRWLTEGIADHETTVARPEWRRRSARHLHDHLRSNPMPGLGELHRAFVQASAMNHMVLAYYYSEQAVDFLERRFGWSRLLDAVRGLGEGMDVATALVRATNVDIQTIDSEFRADLTQRLSMYGETRGATALEAATVAGRRGGLDAAIDQARLAAQFDPEALEPLALLEQLYREKGQQDMAFESLQRLGKMAGMNLGVQKRLLNEQIRRQLTVEAKATAEIVLDIDPSDSEARKLLGP